MVRQGTNIWLIGNGLNKIHFIYSVDLINAIELSLNLKGKNLFNVGSDNVKSIREVFTKTEDEATRIMLKIHTEGMAVCGIYPHEIAETKMNQVLKLAKEAQHPLQSIIEKI